MRLKCIKLAGFKSFVDPTTVSFPSNLCAVVGPNGCGKSNIIDAVRWVMGESSAKNLRGEAMTDVIFNGSGGRKPVGQASIELVFDNSDGTIVGEYAGFSEISIKRKVTREAQNFYYLNGSKCRRRDITDIFLGTGLGPRSYAIIEQGMISRLIEAKPEELRVYIEEAAGISKYKERRRDTENRMRRTQENLERLTDIREELERQLLRLERQSQAAEKYTIFKKEERQLKADLQGLKYKILVEELEVKYAAIKALELKVEASVTDQVHQDSEIEKYRTQYTDLGDKFNEVQGRFYSIGAEIARVEQFIQHSQERERQLKVDLEQTERDCREAEEHLGTDLHKAEGWEAELLEIEPDLEEIKCSEEESGSLLMEAEESMQGWQQKWDNFNQQAAEPRQQAEVQQSRIKYLEQVQSRLLQRIEKLEAEKESLVVGDVEEEINELDEELATLELTLEGKNQSVERLSDQVNDLREKQHQLGDERDKVRDILQTSKGRRASLETLQEAALGRSSGALGEWLESEGLGDYPRLAEKLSVSEGWDKAAEVVLGSSLQAVCSDGGLDEFFSRLASFDAGELTILAKSDIQAVSTSSISLECLAGKLESSFNLSAMVAGIYLAENLEQVSQFRGQLAPAESIVTRDGIWIGPNWLKVAKEEDSQSGVIARQKELESLELHIVELEESADNIVAEYEQTKLQLLDKEKERDETRREAGGLSRQYGELRGDVSSRKAKVEQVLEGRERTDRDIREAKEQMEQEAENLRDARSMLQEAIEAMETDTVERENLLSQRDSIRSKLDEARQKARHDKDKSHELAMRVQSVKTQLGSIRQGVQRLKDQMQRMQERKTQLQDSLADNSEPVEESKLELEAQLEKRIAVEKELTEARAALETVEAAMRDAEKIRHQVEQSLSVVRHNLETARLEAKSLDVKSEGLKKSLEDEEFDLEEVIASLGEDVSESTMEEELVKIGNRISRLGPINLAAIDEYKTESERKHYLDTQNQDLEEALATLENAIKKIDRETRTRFKETFDQINNGLQELFPKVFGGGHAYLELTGEDMLDTGIAIMARPPGKKNSTIYLLSGGEKALTAIALVFSIFRLNPAPFCMLDEVDAPLDDANVGRYARMVEEMSSQVQFIYITHNKIAMEMAHQLMGVTMHEPGVSRMVTVDVEAAAELAEA